MGYITSNFPTSAKILDIGCGNGTYADLLKPKGYKLDGVEVYRPNIEKYNLKAKYEKVYEVNAIDFTSRNHYDLVIFGDVLEHFTEADARYIISRYKSFCDVILVSVPYMMGQGAYEGNTYETHLQPDLNDKVFTERYPDFKNIIVESAGGETIAVWVYDGRSTVMINVLLKNSEPYFMKLTEEIGKLRYPKSKISLMFLENDSEDNTYKQVRNYAEDLLYGEGYARLRIDQMKFGFKLLPTERHRASKQAERLTILKTLREHVNKSMYAGEDFIWNVDHDFMEMDKWLLNKMVSADKDVLMVPVYLPDGSIYDLGTGKFDPKGNFMIIPDLKRSRPNDEIMEIDACSAACFFRGSLIGEGVSYLSPDPLEQEGVSFSKSVKSVGASIWLLSKEKITHQPIDGNAGRRPTGLEVFKNIYEKNIWGGVESKSGFGSDLNNTVKIREEFPKMLKRLACKSILDIPCGDVNWISRTDIAGVKYVGADIVPAAVDVCRKKMPGAEFLVLDLVNDSLPKTDAILCRDCIGHLTLEDGAVAMGNIRNSGARYLISTTFPSVKVNANCTTGDWRPVNLEIAPYSLGKPIDLMEECSISKGKYLGVWIIGKQEK